MTSASSISVGRYDKIKNCTTDLSKHATSREYLTYFNCGHVSTSSDGQTNRDFTLVIDENQKIPISDEGHVFDGWTFNGTIPGPTMRVTQGDHVRIKVINSPGNQHPHSLHLHSIHAPRSMECQWGAMRAVQYHPEAVCLRIYCSALWSISLSLPRKPCR